MKSITFKLFLMTTIVFGLLIGGMMLIQSTFFEDYYIRQKSANVKNTVVNLTKLYASPNTDANEKIAEYAAQNGLLVFYLSADSNDVVHTGVFVSNPSMLFSQEYYKERIEYGKTLYEQNKPLADAGEILDYQSDDPYGNKIICTVNSVVIDEEAQGLLYTFASLQPIGEAASVIKDYYIIFFAVTFALTAALSILYSRQIARPMIHINRIAGKIAELDFSEECTYQSKDELGQLSSTVNRLSANLSDTIEQLEESNRKLKDELVYARKLEQQRKQLIADVSHELKTPLSVIRGYVERLSDENEPDSTQGTASVIMSQAEKMDRLISGMLDLSSLEAGAVTLEKTAVSLERIIRYILKMKADEMAKKSLSVACTAEKGLLAMCDTFRIEQVLSNLIGNAIQYTPESGYIRIRVTRNSSSEVSCEIENGEAHIPESEMEDIWNHFHRVEKSRNKKYGGVGLGLSIVKQILELHGSRFGIRNTQTGVLFSFTLEKFIEA